MRSFSTLWVAQVVSTDGGEVPLHAGPAAAPHQLANEDTANGVANVTLMTALTIMALHGDTASRTNVHHHPVKPVHAHAALHHRCVPVTLVMWTMTGSASEGMTVWTHLPGDQEEGTTDVM